MKNRNVKIKNRLLLCISLSLFVWYGFCQQVVWNADLPVVDKSDYYNVELTQELIGAGLKYLKILDEQETEVPYFIRSSDPIQEINSFESYELKSNIAKDSLNMLLVDNRQAENLNRFCIVLQRADVRKYAAVRGSNDLKQWYIVKQQTEVSNLRQSDSGNTEMIILDFPQSNYRYYEITLQNTQRSPLEVHQVGKIKNSSLYGWFVAIKTGPFVQENDPANKQTILHFPDLPHTYCINKIEFGIKNKPDYYRQAILFDSVSYQRNEFSLSSRKENILYPNDFVFGSHTVVLIENQQNPPLVIDSIKIYGLCRYACAYLEAGKRYHIALNTAEPVGGTYDIERFRDEIAADQPIIRLTNVSGETKIPVITLREPSLIERPLFLWSVILIVGVFLCFICLKMIKDIKSK